MYRFYNVGPNLIIFLRAACATLISYIVISIVVALDVIKVLVGTSFLEEMECWSRSDPWNFFFCVTVDISS